MAYCGSRPVRIAEYWFFCIIRTIEFRLEIHGIPISDRNISIFFFVIFFVNPFDTTQLDELALCVADKKFIERDQQVVNLNLQTQYLYSFILTITFHQYYSTLWLRNNIARRPAAAKWKQKFEWWPNDDEMICTKWGCFLPADFWTCVCVCVWRLAYAGPKSWLNVGLSFFVGPRQ